MSDTLYISRCPLSTCHWESEPCATEGIAGEALRLHLSGHTHGDLIGFTMNHIAIECYQKLPEAAR